VKLFKLLEKCILWLIVNSFLPGLIVGAWLYLSPEGFWQMFAMIAGSIVLFVCELGLAVMSAVIIFTETKM